MPRINSPLTPGGNYVVADGKDVRVAVQAVADQAEMLALAPAVLRLPLWVIRQDTPGIIWKLISIRPEVVQELPDGSFAGQLQASDFEPALLRASLEIDGQLYAGLSIGANLTLTTNPDGSVTLSATGGGGGAAAWGSITGTLSSQTDLQTALNAKAAASHTHTISQVTDAGTAASRNVATTGDASATQVVLGNDSRLSNSRTPTAHSHAIADVTNLQDILTGKVETDQVGVSVASLDGSGFLPRQQATRDSVVRQLNQDFRAGALTQSFPLRSSATAVVALRQVGVAGNITFQLQTYPSEVASGATVVWDGTAGNAAAAITALNSRLSAVSPAADVRLQVVANGVSGTVGTLFLDHIPTA